MEFGNTPCYHCEKAVIMLKEKTVYHFPKILVIHLERFDTCNKVKDNIEAPRTIDMRRYGPYSNHASKEKARQYKQFAICKHYGDRINSGHYEA